MNTIIEVIAFISGLGCVWLASRQNIWTWFLGTLNALCLFNLFQEAQLYSDQMLQLFFIGANVYGAYSWDSSRTKEELRIKTLSNLEIWNVFVVIWSLTFFIGYWMSEIHSWIPNIKPAAYPYIDSCIAISSIVATIGLARKVLENWLLWILIDLVCVYVYFDRELYLISLQYLILGILAYYGYRKWKFNKI